MTKTLVLAIAIAIVGSLPTAAQQATSGSSPAASGRALLGRYCVTCHNEKLKTAGLMLDKVDLEHVSADAEVWEKVIRKLRTGAMPPAGMPRPDKAAYDSLATYLESSLDSAASSKPNPGRPAAIHRLNRTEYSNAIRDLLALEIDGASLLPADDSGYGFDNIGDVLLVSPMLLDRYMSAAQQISRLAIGDASIRPLIRTYHVPKFGLQDQRANEDLPLGSRGGITVRHHFPLDGEYVLRIALQKTFARDYAKIIGVGEPHQLDVWLDGGNVKRFVFGGQNVKAEEVESSLQFRFPAQAGTHLLGVAFADESMVPEGMYRPPSVLLQLGGWGPKSDNEREPGVESISIDGPYAVKGAADTPSRRKIFICSPKSNNEEVCARKILLALARRAYRRPVTDADAEHVLKLYRAGRRDGFAAGIGMALEGILDSYEFLFRAERDPANVAAATPYAIGDLELASRLSFFLWSSIPDDQLLDLAERGKLKNSEVLQQQVRRMLADSRSKALVHNFFGQWLLLRSLRSASPGGDIFPDFDENLRDAFQRETELFLESMLREDRSVLDLLNANYTFVNERLARHYGIPNIYGSRFRRVTLSDENRWGVLGKGSILTVTSLPNRTSVVLRGKWVLENILGTPPPPPPPNVPALQENNDTQRLTMRQRMEQHRANPVCASCHSRMDPLGFALENFDAVGKWRTAEINQSWHGYQSTITEMPIDASGALPDGIKFQGPAELRRILMRQPAQFVTTVAEKLLTYALGRGVEYYDQPAIREILRQSAPSDYRWSSIILAVVKSTPFQMRMSQGSDEMKVASGKKPEP